MVVKDKRQISRDRQVERNWSFKWCRCLAIKRRNGKSKICIYGSRGASGRTQDRSEPIKVIKRYVLERNKKFEKINWQLFLKIRVAADN